MPNLTVRPVNPAVCAEIGGVDVANLSDAEFREVERAWYAHSALLFRGQQLTDDDLLAFCLRFGEHDPTPVNENGKKFDEGYQDINVV